jgi:DNA replication protein DnaC
MGEKDARRRRAGMGLGGGTSLQDIIAHAQESAEAWEGDEGSIVTAEELRTRDAARRHDAHIRNTFAKGELKMTFGTFSPSTDAQSAAKLACEKFAQDVAGRSDLLTGMMLSSPPGRGKTHLAMATLLEVASPDCDVRVCAVPSFLASIKASFSKNTPGDPDQILSWHKQADLLLLDDLGAERETEWAIETLYLLVDHRVKHELPTIITTNLTPTEFVARANGKFTKNYGDDPIYCSRIYSRLRGMVIGNIHLLDGDDYRARVN